MRGVRATGEVVPAGDEEGGALRPGVERKSPHHGEAEQEHEGGEPEPFGEMDAVLGEAEERARKLVEPEDAGIGDVPEVAVEDFAPVHLVRVERVEGLVAAEGSARGGPA